MISPFMAGAIIPSNTLAAISASSLRLQALSRLPRIGQTLRPVYSRAFCSWVPNDVGQNRQPSKSKLNIRNNLQPASLFSTSTTRRLKVEDGKIDSQVEVGPITSCSLCGQPCCDVELSWKTLFCELVSLEFSSLFGVFS